MRPSPATDRPGSRCARQSPVEHAAFFEVRVRELRVGFECQAAFVRELRVGFECQAAFVQEP